jgi:hypothetical protein
VTEQPIPPTPVITLFSNQLTSNSSSGNQWYKDGVLIPGATGQTYNATSFGVYTVVTTVNGCASSVSNALTYLPTAVSPGLAGNELSIVPNPVVDELLVRFSGATKLETLVYTVDGKLLAKKQFQSRCSLSMKSFAAGTYIVVVRNIRTGESVQKMILKL